MQILLVEDDRPLARSLQKALRQQGYVVNHVETGEAALHVMEYDRPDLVVLDVGLPDIDGFAVLRRLRPKDATLPVLMLTARDQLEDKITGLDAGADDYLVKPFDMSELTARLRVLERRLTQMSSAEITLGDVTLDTASQKVSCAGQELELSRREYMLLKSLMENAGRVQTRSALEARLYSWGDEISSNALEVHIHHLRKKLGNDFIRTIRGVGYRIDQALS